MSDGNVWGGLLHIVITPPPPRLSDMHLAGTLV